MRLRTRGQPHPPGGFRFFQAKTNWSITPWLSFEAAVTEIIKHRLGNPWLINREGFSIDPTTVANELDAYNTKVCQEMNWNNFIIGGDLGLYPGIVTVDPPPPPRKLLTKCCGQK